MLDESLGNRRMTSKKDALGRGRIEGKTIGEDVPPGSAQGDRARTDRRAPRSMAGAAGARSRVTWQGFVDWMATRNA
jgi:hypothetical protein